MLELIDVRKDVSDNVGDIVIDETEPIDQADSDKKEEDVTESRGPTTRVQKNHPVDGMIGYLNEGIST